MAELAEIKKRYGKLTENVLSKGEEIYLRLKDDLERENKGRYIVMEPETGEYFIGDDELQLIKTARQKFPDKIFRIKKIGHKAAGFLR